ncbi:Uncharacterised protein [Mycobacteroides abscessus subsp. massiliense]|nr:Uncharacterised protein [Mycobacteroides abscessus subsp. massiliense]
MRSTRPIQQGTVRVPWWSHGESNPDLSLADAQS